MERGAANVAYIYDLNGSAGIPSVMGPGGNGPPSSLGAGGGGGVSLPAHSGGSLSGSLAALLPPPHGVGGSSGLAGLAGLAGLPGLPGPPDDNYCLKWNDYEKKYVETFRDLRDDEYFTDVTLATEGYSVKAHRVILSACSNYFHAILKNMSPWQHPVLLLQEVQATDLTSLMDFMYFGQVSVNQDSLQSFLRVAKKLKIKGLCDSIVPPSLPPHLPTSVVTSVPMSHAPPPPPVVMPPPPRQITSSAGPNFEGLLPRSPYIPEPSGLPLGPNSGSGPNNGSPSLRPPPVAHQQSPRQGVRSGTRPAAEPLVHYASPKRTKYALSPQSILRSQLQLKEGDHVEVKSEPMAILTTQEDVPSSGVNVNEFITPHENDLALPSLNHGISPQFMFSPDPPDNGNGAGTAGGTQGTMVAIDKETAVRLQQQQQQQQQQHQHQEQQHHQPQQHVVQQQQHQQQAHHHGPGGQPQSLPQHQQTQPQHHHQQQQHTQQPQHSHHDGAPSPGVSVATMAGNSSHLHSTHSHLHPPPPASHTSSSSSHSHHLDEPQDLTPAPQDSPNTSSLHHTPNSSINNGQPCGIVSLGNTPVSTPNSANNSMPAPHGSPSTPTPPKKDRNSRKTCGYCHKDFHEMSLKRHIKDVHFRNQNTYVICPQCCKQYASQNSLYSHLNRVHGVKKDMMGDIPLQMTGGSSAGGTPGQNNSSSSSVPNNQSGSSATGGNTPSTPGDNHHDGIMDLAHHSDSSN
ncbi:broad-complex core protein-like [Tigriopus californicus]|uniref:broad-complex core protein-like n=1 Tax=Tigriopus californicus TaxID=6832 RepID=UPI0027DAAA5D|nr:broad-complex core protein-like [Tigriopus californicus]